MRLKLLTNLNTLLLVAVCLALGATLWWSQRALERPYLLMERYLGLSQVFQNQAARNIEDYLASGDALRLSSATQSLESLQLASIFSTYPAPELSIWHAALVEVVITSMLMGMIMALTDDGNGVPKGPLAPLLIGILVAVIGASTGPLTGFAMNPARDFGPKLFTWFAGWGNIAMTGGRDIPYFIVPIIAPLLGACLGAAIYRFLIANNLPCHTCVEEENTR